MKSRKPVSGLQKWKKWNQKLRKTLLVFGVAIILAQVVYRDRNVLGAGKPKPQNPAQPAPVCTVPNSNPVRAVVLRPVATKAFQLPNGAAVNLSADLDALLATAVTQTGLFSPADPFQGGPACDQHLELRAAVSTLELNAFELGVTFGYTPAGADATLANLTGQTNVKIGTIAMEFGLWNCQASRCTQVIASTANHVTAGVSIGMQIDFGAIKTGPSLVANTQLGSMLRVIMNDGMKKVAASSRLSELPWHATVREVNTTNGSFILDAGASSRVAPGAKFEVYAVTPATTACNVYKVVAYGQAIQVDGIATTAVIEQQLDARGIQEGDWVRFRP